MNGGNQNHLGVDGGGNGGIDIGNNQQSNASMPSPNPQTPSSIPDILISSMFDIQLFNTKILVNSTMPHKSNECNPLNWEFLITGCGDDSGPDQTLQRLIAMGEFDNDSMFSEELRADLGKLDDNMIRYYKFSKMFDFKEYNIWWWSIVSLKCTYKYFTDCLKIMFKWTRILPMQLQKNIWSCSRLKVFDYYNNKFSEEFMLS